MVAPIEANYEEQFLFPPSLEDWVDKKHPTRFLRELVAQMDMQELGIRMPELKTGRPPYSAKLLLRVWLYGYWKRIRSSRKLEEACRENIGFIWLCGKQYPDHNTLWRFFKKNKKGLRQLFKTTVKTAVKLGLVNFALQAVDGTKIQATSSGHGTYDQTHLEKKLKHLDEDIEKLEKEIEEENHKEPKVEIDLPKDLQDKKRLKEKVQQALETLKTKKIRHCHPSDLEARRMKCEGRNRFSYNAQAVVDEGNYIITAADVSQAPDDSGLLLEMGQQTVENTDKKPEVLLADGGYVSADQLQKVEEVELDVLAPLPPGSLNKKKNPYHTSNFQYDQETDEFICPEGRRLPFSRERIRPKNSTRVVREYKSSTTCKGCPVRSLCTKDKRYGRAVELLQGYEARERLRKRLEIEENQKKLKKRGQIVELIFAWIKQMDGFRRWTAHGVEHAKTQWSIVCSVWNIKQIYKNWLKNFEKPSAIMQE